MSQGFRSVYQDMDPALYVGDPRRPVSELLERDKRAFLARQRGILRQAKAYRERAAAEQVKRAETLERAKEGEARAALKVAVDAYTRWTDKRAELKSAVADRERVLSDLLANQPETVDLEALRAHSTQVGDCRLMVDALRAQISAWDEKRNEPLSALRQALSAAEVEVNTLHQVERERRISEAREKLEEIRDWEKITFTSVLPVAELR